MKKHRENQKLNFCDFLAGYLTKNITNGVSTPK